MKKKNPFSGDKVYIIAEIGSSHQGDLKKMKSLVLGAKKAGADCVKTQWIYAHEILPPKAGILDLPGGKIELYKVFQNLEVEKEFYREMKSFTEALGMDWCASPFGIKSAQELLELDPLWVKIASPELNHLPLLDFFKHKNKPLILSTGVARLEDIQEALRWTEGCERGLMHCITAYPAPEEEYNLRIIPFLHQSFGLPVGLSDHSLHPVQVPLLACTQGARFIEKHFTLSKTDGGLDDPVALEPQDFQHMVTSIRTWEGLGRDQRQKWVDQLIPKEKQELLLGEGKKELAPSERSNYNRTNRSLHATRDLAPGEILKESDIAVLRTEKILRPGMHPRFLPLLPGKKTKQPIPWGEGIREEDILGPLV